MSNVNPPARVRRFCAIVSCIVALLPFSVASIGMNEWTFTTILLSWFTFLICIFHFIFFYCTSIDNYHVKLVDYPYLLIVAFGIFLAALASSQERYVYTSAIDEIAAPSTPAGLKSFIDAAANQLCAERGEYVPRHFCEWSTRVVKFLNNGYTNEQLSSYILGIEKTRDEQFLYDYIDMLIFYASNPTSATEMFYLSMWPLSRSFSSRIGKQPIIVHGESVGAYFLIIRSMQKIYENRSNTQLQKISTTADLESFAIGFGKVVVWPFVLAIALALRITKVTADVLGWAAERKS